ncbi:citron Rho-interacting kinase isoform X2 [Drosophila montana]|uniref:citron Rho-interacting kinase isoform X2 n=1 Tax=Drosophila montana TaxID=40370 RepID=UPI00313E7D10
MNMPKAVRQDLKEDDSNLFLKPHPYGNGGQQQQQGKKKANGEGHSNGNGSQKKAVFDPISTENVLKCYIKYHKASIESVKKKSNEISEKMLKTNMAIAERNQENALLRKQLHNIELKVEELNKMSDALGQENSNLKEKCTAVEEKYVSLETAYDKEFAHLKATLAKQKAELKQNDKLLEELKALQLEKQQMVARLETMAQQKADEMAELQIKNAQLQLQISEVEAAFEQYKLKSVEQNEAVQAKLTVELQQQAAELSKQIENSVKREAELQATLTTLKDVEKRGLKLQQLNQQLTLEVSEVETRLNAEIEQQKLKIEDLNSQIQKLKSDEQRYQDEIELLEEAKEQLEASKEEAAALAKSELGKVESHELKLKKNMEELQEEHLKITKALSAENAGLTQQLEALKQLYETKMNSLEEELNQKCAAHIDDQQQFAELERQKNATIAELTYKINQISNVFGQPVGTVGAMSNHHVGQKKTNEATISMKKNRFGYGNANTTIVRPSPQETDDFDKLKNSGN